MGRRFQCGAVVTAAATTGKADEVRFRLEPSQQREGWWVLTDMQYMVVVRFAAHRFNDEQKVTVLDDSRLQSDDITDAMAAQMLAKVMREIGDYMSYHTDIAL